MSTFQVPFSSSPPSTPDTRRRSNPFANSFASNPSTTPAGPPPGSSLLSFTPDGNPPSSKFGSSPPNALRGFTRNHTSPGSPRKDAVPLFAQSARSHGQSPLFSSRGSDGLSNQSSTRSNGSRNDFAGSAFGGDPMDNEDVDQDLSPSRDLRAMNGTLNPASRLDIMDQAGEEGDSDMLQGNPLDGSPSQTRKPMFKDSVLNRFGASRDSDSGIDWTRSALVASSPRGTKRSRGGAVIANTPLRNGARHTSKDSPLPNIIKGMANQLGTAKLHEPGGLILQTEKAVGQLERDEILDSSEEEVSVLLSKASEQAIKIWSSYQQPPDPAIGEDGLASVGPSAEALDYQKATFLGSLLLPLHHPPSAKGRQAYAAAKRERFAKPQITSITPTRPTPIPKVLLDWLDQNHNPYPNAAGNVLNYHPNSTANHSYWDVVHSCTLRGKISQVIDIFENSQFQYALTSRDDGFKHNGYQGQTLLVVDAVIDRCVLALKPYLSLQDGALDISRNDWLLFRQGIIKASQDLTMLAEGKDQNFDPQSSIALEASNFGLKPASTLLSQSLRRAESRVPWTIYQNLKTVYGILLGSNVEILASSQDWVEASIALTAWWDGDDEDGIEALALVQSTTSHRRSGFTKANHANRLVDMNPPVAYQRRLAAAFERTTGEKDELFQVDTLNAVNVGLASIFEGNADGVIGLLRGWSLPIAAATVEIGSLGGWFPSPELVEEGFDESDLLVLSSYGQPRQQISKDNMLIEYSSALFEREKVEDKNSGDKQEGWMLSIRVLSRMEDSNAASEKLKQLIAHLPLESDQRVDRILEVCNDFDMEQEAYVIAERYASTILSSSTIPQNPPPIRYGTALNYYARAHASLHIHSLFNTLISLSLLHSAPYPQLSELDPNLAALVDKTKAKGILKWLRQEDEEAARLLGWEVTGYATLRHFYDLRDTVEKTSSPNDNDAVKAKRKEAFDALLAVIASAADPIQGGLYDMERHSVVQVDSLLCLLGEALPFLIDTPSSEHGKGLSATMPLPTQKQLLNLLRAIESLDTMDESIFRRCEDAFRVCISSDRHQQGKNRSGNSDTYERALLSKQISALTSSSSALSNSNNSSSGFLLTGSEMLDVMSASESGSFGRSSNNPRSGKSDQMIILDDEDDNDGDNEASQGMKKGWDWRQGLEGLEKEAGHEAQGKDVLRILRLGIERKLGEIWAKGGKRTGVLE